MKKLHILGLVAGLVAFCSSGLAAQWFGTSACPYAYPAVGQTVIKVLVSPRLEWSRKKFSLETIDPSAVRPLQDASDAATCRQLTSWVEKTAPFGLGAAPWDRVYYRANGMYMVVFHDRRPKHDPAHRMNALIVLRGDLSPVAYVVPK